MGISNQLKLRINKKNLLSAKEEIYKVIEGKLGLKEDPSDNNEYLEIDTSTLNEIDDAIIVNIENSLDYNDKVEIIIKSQDADKCINFYKVIKEAVNGL